jgi:hypothetical protein
MVSPKFSSHAYPPPLPRTEKTSKKINKNDKNLTHATNLYGKFEILIFFVKKGWSELKRL